MVVLWEKGWGKSSNNIIFWAAAYDAVGKWTLIPIQQMKTEYMMILQQKKVILVNDETSSRNPDYN